MNVLDLLDQAKQQQGITTDKALAEAVGVTKQSVSNWRKGVSLPDVVACGKLAKLTAVPLAKVLGIVGEQRAISRDEKAVWKQLATAAAVALCAIGATYLIDFDGAAFASLHLMFTAIALAGIVGTEFVRDRATSSGNHHAEAAHSIGSDRPRTGLARALERLALHSQRAAAGIA